MKIITRILAILFLTVTFVSTAVAEDSFIVKDIEIIGLQRISAGTVLNYLPVEVGQKLQESDTVKIIRTLYKTGFFSSVNLERKQNTLIIIVKERQTIGSIFITGNKEIPTDALMDSLKTIGVAEGRVYDKSVMDGVRESLQNQYTDRGNYNAKVSVNVTNQTDNRVGVVINIQEGKIATIKSIKIIGNRAFSEKTLLRKMELTTTQLWTFVTKTDQYSREKLDADLEKINSFYQDQGYIEFKIISSQVSITPKRDEVYIVIRINEGSQYRFKGYDITGEMVKPKAELMPLVDIKKGEIFSRKQVNQASKDIGNYLANFGYAFVTVKPIPEIDEESKQVLIVFLIEPGEIVYVRRINFYGNTKTQDEVLRRTIRQEEGSVSSLEKLRLSEKRLNMLGYFKTVNFKTKKVPGSEDEIDIDVTVQEQPSASVSLSVGYSDTDKFLINAGFNQPNFMGTGSTFGVNVASTAYVKSASMSYFNPTYSEYMGRGFSLYGQVTNYADSDVVPYTSDQFGGDIFYSFPIAEKSNLSFGYGYQFTNLRISNQAPLLERQMAAQVLADAQNGVKVSPESFAEALHILKKGAPIELIDFKDDHGERFRNILLKGSWAYKNLEGIIYPTGGFENYFDTVVAVKASTSSLNYYKANYLARYFQPLLWDFILVLRSEFGYGGGIFGDDVLPFYENYYAGGIDVKGAIRGYQGYSVGPKSNRGHNLGGNFLADGSIGLIFPLPYVPETFRAMAYFDAGNVYSNIDPIFDPYLDPYINTCPRGAGPLRMSAGLQVQWRSPIGPLVLSLAKPLNAQVCDHKDPLQFTVASTF